MEIDAASVIWSRPPAERAGRPLVLLLHGFGSNEQDLASLTPDLPADPVYAALRAPIPQGPGYAWFTGSLDDLATPQPEDVEGPTRAILRWIGRFSRASQICLVGFSQGGAISLSLMRSEPDLFPAAVVLSAHVVGAPQPGDSVLHERRPPVFWGRGAGDALIPDVLVERTRRWLESHATLDEHLYPRLGHGVGQEELADVRAFLDVHLPAGDSA